MNAALLLCVIILYVSCTTASYSDGHSRKGTVDTDTDDRYIRIALAIDEHSYKDYLILMTSVLTTAIDNNYVVFHILACGQTIELANALRDMVVVGIDSCLSDVKYDVVGFTLPPNSGMMKQLINTPAKKRSHWYSPSGADMARFYLASFFPHVNRLLYLDNDVVVSCCLEDIWNTYMDSSTVVGIALDDLKWASSSQFQRQYNSTHAQVIRNIRRKINTNIPANDLNPNELDEREFLDAVPKYPNDGVLLIDVKKYNKMNILKCIDTIATANSLDYVVGLGTQQFTVLCLFDKWTELSPRSNLRHFPDMARGYLMWFLYNGFLHFAGLSKPRHICQWGDVSNEHRAASYVPWATAVFHLHHSCNAGSSTGSSTGSTFDALQADTCSNHIPVAETFAQLLHFIHVFSQKHRDSSNIVLAIGDASLLKAVGSSPITIPLLTYDSIASDSVADGAEDDDTIVDSSESRHMILAGGHKAKPHTVYVRKHRRNSTSTLGHIALNAPYNAVDEVSVLSDMLIHNTTWAMHFMTKSPVDVPKYLHSYKRIHTHAFNYCDSMGVDSNKRHQYMYNFSTNPVYAMTPCTSILQQLEALKIKHWSPVGILIDRLPYADVACPALQILRNTDLTFLRPKFIYVRLTISATTTGTGTTGTGTDIFAYKAECLAILKRYGFIAVVSASTSCGSDTRYDSVCIWGTRTSVFELGL